MIQEKISKSNPFIRLGLLFFALLQFQNATYGQESRLDSLKNELHRLKPKLVSSLKDSSYVNTLNALAFEIRYTNRDSLHELSKQALLLSKKIGYIKGEIGAYVNLGNYHSDDGYHSKAVELMSKALEKSRVHKLYTLELRAISHLAIVHDYLDEDELAFKEMLAGIDIATKLDNKKFLSLFNLNIGVLYHSLNEYPEAVSYLKIAKTFSKSYGDEMITAMINSNLASCYNHMETPEIGMRFINEAIATFEKNKVQDWIAFAYTTKGKTYLHQHDYTSALHWFIKSEDLYSNVVDDERSESILFLGMAETNLSLDKDSIAKVQAKRGYDLAKNFKDKERQQIASKLLYKLYKKENNVAESFKYLEVFQQLSDTLAQSDSKKKMLMLKTQKDYEKQKQDLIETNKKSLSKQTNIIASILALVLVLTGFILLVLRNQKKQEKLNQELKKSESELIETNETKNKLFSIISHDLQGPVGAFSKLMVLFNQGEIEKEKLVYFLPKLETDIKYISFTLNNLLSWGRMQMKADITKPIPIDLEGIITENINLLSEIAFQKSIAVLNKVELNTVVWADRDQIDIVIRNLISNALKFTPENGSVTITAIENHSNWEVSIQDTGVGMDQNTQNKIFDCNSTITTYGTNNEKGTGLGLSLCKELIENNIGTIVVHSIPNLGTCFKFTLAKPKLMVNQKESITAAAFL